MSRAYDVEGAYERWLQTYVAKSIISVLCIIAAELGRALAVVKVTSQVNGNPHFGVPSPKNY